MSSECDKISDFIYSNFVVSDSYNYSLDTECNYTSEEDSFVGKYKNIRSLLDYNYHKHYSAERQLLQDQLIDRFLDTIIIDGEYMCEKPLQNWIVFTAGPMGSGKGHTIKWLASQNLLPLESFVNVDPDSIRALLPEIQGYNQIDPQTSGFKTQKEVGYISETLTYNALKEGKNVLVDGSLRDAHWYLKYFHHLRQTFPSLKIAILSVTATFETVLRRVKERANISGREVPEKVIIDSIERIPLSLEILSPRTDFIVTFTNEDDNLEPKLLSCTMKSVVATSNSYSIEDIWSLQAILEDDDLANNVKDERISTHSLENSNHVRGYWYTTFGSTTSINHITDWKPIFSEVFIMVCALPDFTNNTKHRQSKDDLVNYLYDSQEKSQLMVQSRSEAGHVIKSSFSSADLIGQEKYGEIKECMISQLKSDGYYSTPSPRKLSKDIVD